ncbi:MAG TPA: TIM barrel protein [Candidatus Brocadiia bacterium]|nr:TIM barrel protein [Candidatus Brocadiia bacterium]
MAPKIFVGVNLNFSKFVYGHKRTLEVVRNEIGVKHVEAVPDMDFGTVFFARKPDKFRAFHEEIAEHANKLGIKIASVLTFYRDNGYICHPDADVRENAYLTMQAMAVQGAAYGAKLVGPVLNCILKEDFEDRSRRAECMEQTWEAWERWLPELGALGVPGATVEQLSTLREPPSTIPQCRQVMDCLMRIYRKSGGKAARPWLCYDLGHGVTDDEKESDGDGSFAAWFKAFPDQIREIHVKNTDSQFMAAWPFSPEYDKKGIIDLNKVAAAIRDYLTGDELYAFVEYPGKRGRIIGEEDALAKNADSVRAFCKALAGAGFVENPADASWSIPGKK